eukprot:TRINITY_DN14009_c0_g1_i4.p2 TRINITY_DN14009_c0_g1~~TRINITY_DN14009_c0_g1_i4.p2  ORF type:complete len:180 (-),score=16.33 TRINITY_DN14009_c0_g1_i4:239-778(-)
MKLSEIPKVFGEFQKQMKTNNKVRQLFDKPKQANFVGLGGVDPGKIPQVSDLHTYNDTKQNECKFRTDFKGGEVEGVNKVDNLIKQMLKNRKVHHGAIFASQVSPWLSLGCLSPRDIFYRMQKNCNKEKQVVQVLKCELLWRDFFRFTTRKMSEINALKGEKDRKQSSSQSLQPCVALS